MAAASLVHARARPQSSHAPQPALTIPKTSKLEPSVHDGRSPVDALNRNRQNLFARELKNFVKAKTRRVAVLLLSWDEVNGSSLRTAREIAELTAVFEQVYHFKVYSKLLSCYRQELPHYQLQTILNDFFSEHDKPGTLLWIYYGGHASRTVKKEELVLRSGHDYRNTPDRESIHWNRIEPSLQRLNADLLLVLDCCYAGIIENTPRVWQSKGHFEFIGSTTWDATARGPDSPGSFTRHLIQALHDFAKEDIPFFTTARLIHKIKSYKNFRIGAKGSICLSTCGKTNVFRYLNILPLKPGHMQASSPVDTSRTLPLNFYLHLKYVFTREPSEIDIIMLVERLSELIKNDGLPISNVLWEGLSKYNPRMQMADAAERLLAKFSRRSSATSTRNYQPSDAIGKQPGRRLSRTLTNLSNDCDLSPSEHTGRPSVEFTSISQKLSRSTTTLSTEEGIMMSKAISPPDKHPCLSSSPNSSTNLILQPVHNVPAKQFSSRRVQTLRFRFQCVLGCLFIAVCALIMSPDLAFIPTSNLEDLTRNISRHMDFFPVSKIFR